jgi:signal transduction histidine kinase
MSRLKMKGGLASRTVVASGLLAIIVAAVIGILLVAIEDLRDSQQSAQRVYSSLSAADNLEKLVIDLETGLRGFVITGEERFLEPWEAARADFPSQAQALVDLTDDADQVSRARAIARAGQSYIDDYSVPLVNTARQNLASARSLATSEEGKERVDALRADFSRFTEDERELITARQSAVDADARRAITAGWVGLAGSVALIVLFGIYFERAIARPVRHTAAAAGQLAAGDLSVRMPEIGAGEVGDLQRAFNVMASSLEANRDELRQLAEEQAALRRVATLVAQAVEPSDVFDTVTREVGLQCDADLARMERFEPDRTVNAVAAWSRTGDGRLAVGTRFTLEGSSIAAQVLETGRPARLDSFDGAYGPIAREAQALGIRSSVGCPIIVGGQTWGVIAASTKREVPFPPDTESAIADFTELVATAVSNAESQAELRASRARVVAAADETRRQIERNLHDGAQQRLVALALGLRVAREAVPPEFGELRRELDRVAAGLTAVIEELREFARGIHPAILTKGGLGPALRALARRSAVPAQVDVRTEGRLPEAMEAGAYYVVSEALTNVAKHARASVVAVEVKPADGVLLVCVRDDGVGGADVGRGSGLVGLKDRVDALGGRITVDSPPGAGTLVRVELPIADTRLEKPT